MKYNDIVNILISNQRKKIEEIVFLFTIIINNVLWNINYIL